MATTPELIDHYKLHPLITGPNAPPNYQQINVFKSWKRDINPTSNPPPRSDLTQPRAVESKLFPGRYLAITWAGGARAAQTDPDMKNLADFVILISADRMATSQRVERVQRVVWGVHSKTNEGIVSAQLGFSVYTDGEHVTWSVGQHPKRTSFHGFIVYPMGVSLGSSDQARRSRWTNRHLTTSHVAFSTRQQRDQGAPQVDANLSEALGAEIYSWFLNTFSNLPPDENSKSRVMVYHPATRQVHVYKEDDDAQSVPEHTFTNLCRLPAEKLGLVPLPAVFGGP